MPMGVRQAMTYCERRKFPQVPSGWRNVGCGMSPTKEGGRDLGHRTLHVALPYYRPRNSRIAPLVSSGCSHIDI